MKPRQPAHTPQFWTIFVFAAFCVLGIVLLQSGKPADRSTAWTCIGLFGSMTLLTGAWEIGRHWQGEGVRWQSIKIAGDERKVWFFPASRLQQWLLVAIMLVVAATGTCIFLVNNSFLHRWEMGAVGLLGLGLAMGFAFSTLTRTRGIALLPSGVLWFKEQHPIHIPWDAIRCVATTRVGQDVGHGIKTYLPALGVRLKANSPEPVGEVLALGRRPLSLKTQKKLAASKAQNGFELTYFDESLIISVEEAARLLNFFLEDPGHRRELQAEQSQLGFLEALLRPDSGVS